MAKTSVSKKIAVRRKPSARLPRSIIGAVHAVQEKKAVDVVVLDLRKAGGFTDYFVICTGTSDRQVRAIAKDIDEQLGKRGVQPVHIEGMQDATWVLLDYGSVIVHVFDPATRDYYRLEKLWAEAPRVLVIQ